MNLQDSPFYPKQGDYCVIFTLRDDGWLLFVFRYLLSVVCCQLSVGCSPLSVIRCLLFVLCCLLSVVCSPLSVLRCLLADI